MATPHATLTQLAQQAAAQIGFTPRRWWREETAPAFLRPRIKANSRRADESIAYSSYSSPNPFFLSG